MISAMTLSLVLGCSGGENNPILTSETSPQGVSAPAQTHLWGLYDIRIDIPSKTVDVTPNRTAAFTVNVVRFINANPANLGFHINSAIPQADSIDVDIDISISHPFLGMHQYDGYDVRGVFMGDGSATLEYNPDLIYPVLGTDQYMLDDPVDGIGGPDGYTRWFNKAEFSEGGMPLFQYTQGVRASPGFDGTATLCPYKYFADGLGKEADLWTWLVANGSGHGVFTAGSNNTRNYYLRFPNSKGIKFGYAVLASWKGTGSQDHPANAREAVAVNVKVTPGLYYVDPVNKGGDLILDFDVFDWDSHPVGGVMSDYSLIVESTVLTGPATFSDMTPTGGGENYSTYHVDIPADNINGTEGNEFWVILEDQNLDYTNEYGVPNLAGTDKLAAFFRYDLTVKGEIPAGIEVISPNGGEEWTVGSNQDITWNPGIVTGTVFIDYSKDDFVSDIHSIATGEPNDGSYEWQSIPDDPSTTVRVRISSTDDPSVFDTSDNYFTIAGECTFTDAPTYGEFVETDVVWSTGYHFMQIDSSRIVSCRFASDGNDSFPWLAVYNVSDFTVPVDTFNVPGWSYPDRPWCFEVDSTDRVFFFMDDDYPATSGSTFDTIYYIDWDGLQLVDSSLQSFSISPFLDSGELGAKIWMDTNDDLYAVTTEGKMLKFDHTAGYAGTELFDLDGNSQYQQGFELSFLLAESINAFFIYTGYGSGLRAIHRVSYDGTVEATEKDIFSGILSKCGTLSGGIGADGDCRLVVVDGHSMYNWATVRYDFALDQKAWNSFTPPELMQPGNTIHFDDEDTIRFNTDAWAPMQTKFVFFDTPSDW
jgi:hypothetical protein